MSAYNVTVRSNGKVRMIKEVAAHILDAERMAISELGGIVIKSERA